MWLHLWDFLQMHLWNETELDNNNIKIEMGKQLNQGTSKLRKYFFVVFPIRTVLELIIPVCLAPKFWSVGPEGNFCLSPFELCQFLISISSSFFQVPVVCNIMVHTYSWTPLIGLPSRRLFFIHLSILYFDKNDFNSPNLWFMIIIDYYDLFHYTLLFGSGGYQNI